MVSRKKKSNNVFNFQSSTPLVESVAKVTLVMFFRYFEFSVEKCSTRRYLRTTKSSHQSLMTRLSSLNVSILK